MTRPCCPNGSPLQPHLTGTPSSANLCSFDIHWGVCPRLRLQGSGEDQFSDVEQASPEAATHQQAAQSPAGWRSLPGRLMAASSHRAGHQQQTGSPEPLHGLLLDQNLAQEPRSEEERDVEDEENAGPGFYRAPLGLHQFAPWARAATRDPHPFPRPPHPASARPASISAPETPTPASSCVSRRAAAQACCMMHGRPPEPGWGLTGVWVDIKAGLAARCSSCKWQPG